MERTIFQDGIEVHGEDFNNTEDTKSTAIKDRKDFVQSGVASGLRVTKPAGTVSIDVGVGYCANGERIEVSPDPITGVTVIPDQYNFITLIYKEVEQKLKPHERTGTSYTTEVIETYLVEVLSTSTYNSLTQLDRDNRVLVAIEKDGVIQQSYDLSKIVITNDTAMQGVWIGQFSENTLYGKCSVEFDRSICKIRYKAPSDITYGVWGDINVNYSDKQSIKLTSGNTSYWVYVEVLYPILPVVSTIAELNVLDLYEAVLKGSMEVRYFTSTGTAEDQVHRATHMLYYPHYKDRGGPKENNPHGTHASDLTGFQGDVIRHQDLMHCNGIITKDFLPTIVVRESKKFPSGTTATITLNFHTFVLAVYKVEALIGLDYTIFTEGEDYIVNLASGTITRIAGSDIPIGGIVYVTYKYQKTHGEISALRPTCDTTNKKVAIEPLGEDNCYHINGVVFWEVDESFPWVYTFGVGTWYVVLGSDKKFHVFQNSYEGQNYIPIVRVSVGSAPPTLSVNKSIISVSVVQGGSPADTTFTVLNTGSGILQYNIYVDSAWLSCTPTSGSQTGSLADIITVKFATNSISIGTYKALIHVVGASGVLNTPKTITVNLVVT